MSEIYNRRLALLGQPDSLAQLKQSLHGIERECLRVDKSGQLSQQPHPKALGATLTHGSITTDYAEPLLEFITAALPDSQQTLEQLEEIHRFTISQLADEVLWAPSMPGVLPDESEIPVAYYGESNIGQFKWVYRQGLAVRYGKTMQCIAGIHYNYSLPDSLWGILQEDDQDPRSAQDYQSARYIALTRNFRRYSWLLMYLFGASPAIDNSFVRHMQHSLERFDDNTLYLPYATSLRMSDLGYQSNAQASLTPCYNELSSYIQSIRKAVATPYPPYAAFGTEQANGEWRQLNTNILQIENEYYSIIRPKRITQGNERPVEALEARGIQYVEARCIDINPFLMLGIDLEQARFLDVFLLYCALQDSPRLEGGECPMCTENFMQVVKQGRKPGLMLTRKSGSVSLQDWAKELFDGMQATAELLDKAYNTNQHSDALSSNYQKLLNVELTPSAQVLASMRAEQQSFSEFALAQSLRHAQALAAKPLTAEQLAYYQQLASQSIAEQQAIEQQPQLPFAEYLAKVSLP